MPKNRQQLVTVAALGLILFAAACLLSWFASRIGDRPFELAQLWFSAASFVATGLGLVALVWTFFEQRKLTEAQSRAYLEIIGASYEPFPGYRGATFRIGVKNVGATPASNICVTGVQVYDLGAIEGKELGEIVTVPFQFVIPGDLPAQAENVGRTNDIFKVPEDELTIEKSRPFGTDTCRQASLTFRGAIHYDDAFGRARILPFDVNTTILRKDEHTELPGARRGAYSSVLE